MGMMKRILLHFLSAAAVLSAVTAAVSCDRFLDITPTGRVIASTGEEYRALLTYEYKYVPEDRGLASFRSDEFVFGRNYTSSEDIASFFDIWTWNDYAQQPTTAQFGWRRYYHAIYISNYIIENQNDISDASAAEISQLVGESYMMRGYMHFLLVNLYSPAYTACRPDTARGIPLQLRADVEQVLKPSSVEAVYRSIVSDMETALSYLNVREWDAEYRYRFSILSAKAILSRVYLYMGNWEKSLEYAQSVITEHGGLVRLNVKGAVMPTRYDSEENLLALEQVMTSLYKGAGRPSMDVFRAYRSGDGRKSVFYNQVTSSSVSLLKGGGNEFSCSIRTAELYLNAAEAAVEMGLKNVAVAYLDSLLETRYSASAWDEYKPEIKVMDLETLRETVREERRLELAFEGHRWFDLRRWDRPAMERTYQEETYTLDENDPRYVIPLPAEVIQANPELGGDFI